MANDDDTNLKDNGGSSKENEPQPSTSTAGPSSPDSVQDSLFEVNKIAQWDWLYV